MSEPQVQVLAAAATSPGLVRERNEDSYLVAPPVFLVADGLGGHSRGEAASQAVVRSFAHLAGRPWLTAEALLGAVDDASASVSSLAAEGAAPGSTLSGVGLADHDGTPCWLIFNIGDSRTYLLDQGRLDQLTVDHSAVVHDGAVVRRRNVITRAIGAGIRRTPLTDQWLVPARTAQRVLICSDGLTNEVTDLLIQACLMSEPHPQAAADRLLAVALEAGGRDNITVVVVDAVAVTTPLDEPDGAGDTQPDRTEPDGLLSQIDATRRSA